MSMQPQVTAAGTQLESGADLAGGPQRSMIEAIGVVVAARNSADTVAPCILSLYAAHNHAGWRNALWIVVVAAGCTDHTAENARRVIGAFGEIIEVPATAAAAALRIGGAAIVEHFSRKPRHVILLTDTAANVCVEKNWMASRLGRQWPSERANA